MPMAKRLIAACLTEDRRWFRKILDEILYQVEQNRIFISGREPWPRVRVIIQGSITIDLDTEAKQFASSSVNCGHQSQNCGGSSLEITKYCKQEHLHCHDNS